jgi:hypothetical protein
LLKKKAGFGSFAAIRKGPTRHPKNSNPPRKSLQLALRQP